MNPSATEHDLHQEIQSLLPWYINQTLATEEHQRVDKHLKECLVCRRDWLDLQKLSDTLIESNAMETASVASFAQLRHQLASQQPANVVPISSKKRHIPISALAGLGLAASVLLVVFTPGLSGFTNSADQALYSTLSAHQTEKHEGKLLKIVFEQNLSKQSVDSLLKTIHAQKIDLPNSLGAFTVRLENSSDLSFDQTLALLRSHEGVLLAEPIQNP